MWPKADFCVWIRFNYRGYKDGGVAAAFRPTSKATGNQTVSLPSTFFSAVRASLSKYFLILLQNMKSHLKFRQNNSVVTS